ncbi:hypothetical protein CBR_g20257 [Chara braunii]|uniref:Uncharacterized protein n=1 Tax=Chara braunii TaxID=69332 RepID=A0A388KZY9_CHABU|nr:hypothetical protein CBR_g20257 [Chara braunii]|eukprot:GBG75627.1 hypothetical protein CBR_g20257 [Chara braunii]
MWLERAHARGGHFRHTSAHFVRLRRYPRDDNDDEDFPQRTDLDVRDAGDSGDGGDSDWSDSEDVHRHSGEMDVFGDREGVEDLWGEYGSPVERGDCDHTADVDPSSGHVLGMTGQSAGGSGLQGAPREGERPTSFLDRASTVAEGDHVGGSATMQILERDPEVHARRLVLDGPPSVAPRGG